MTDPLFVPPVRRFRARPGRCVFCGGRTRLLEFHHAQCAEPLREAERAQALDDESTIIMLCAELRVRTGEKLVTDFRNHDATTINGCGISFYGRAAPDDKTDSFLATKWITLLWIPLVPLGRYRIMNSRWEGMGRHSFTVLGRVPLRAIDWLTPPLIVGALWAVGPFG